MALAEILSLHGMVVVLTPGNYATSCNVVSQSDVSTRSTTQPSYLSLRDPHDMALPRIVKTLLCSAQVISLAVTIIQKRKRMLMLLAPNI